MANWDNPINTTTYTSVLSDLKERDTDAGKMFDPAVISPTNLPDNTIRWNSVNSKFEIKNGTWGDLDTEYDINVLSLNGLSSSDFLLLNPGSNQTITSGKLILDINAAAALDLKGGTADEVYMQFFADTNNRNTRTGYIGFYGAAGETLDIVNEYTNGDIYLTTNGTGVVRISDRLEINGTTQYIDFTTSLNIYSAGNLSITAGSGAVSIDSSNSMTFTINGDPLLSLSTSTMVAIGGGALTVNNNDGFNIEALTILQDASQYGIKVTQNGATSAILARADNLGARAGYFYSDMPNRTQPLVEIHNDNATGTGVALVVTQDQGGNAIEINGDPVIPARAVVTNHIRVGNIQIVNGLTTTGYGAFSGTSLTFDTVRSVGPTGSGAFHIWDALDDLPAEARVLIIDLRLDASTDGVGTATLEVYASEGSTTLTDNLTFNGIGSLELDEDANISGNSGHMNRTYIPLNASHVFNMQWNGFNTDSESILLYYRGFITD